MIAKEVKKIVLAQIDGQWQETNAHRVDLSSALVTPPRQTKMIQRLVHKGRLKDSVVDVWVVLEECSDDGGYVIFYDDERGTFGLASNGFPHDQHMVICGYYGDSWNALKGM